MEGGSRIEKLQPQPPIVTGAFNPVPVGLKTPNSTYCFSACNNGGWNIVLFPQQIRVEGSAEGARERVECHR